MKIILTTILGVALLTVIGQIIPVPFTAHINDAIIYFISFINYAPPFFHVAVFIECVQVLVNFLLSVALLNLVMWFSRFVAQ